MSLVVVDLFFDYIWAVKWLLKNMTDQMSSKCSSVAKVNYFCLDSVWGMYWPGHGFLTRGIVCMGCLCLARLISHLGAFLRVTCWRHVASAFMSDKSGPKGGKFVLHLIFSSKKHPLSNPTNLTSYCPPILVLVNGLLGLIIHLTDFFKKFYSINILVSKKGPQPLCNFVILFSKSLHW